MTLPTEKTPPPVRPVLYRGEPLDSERGPGLGCFRFQIVVLAILIVLAPLSVTWGWPPIVSAGLLFAVLILLLVAGQTIIFLLRLVAADRRAAGRRRPLRSGTPTVGEIEDAQREAVEGEPPPEQGPQEQAPEQPPLDGGSPDEGPVRQ